MNVQLSQRVQRSFSRSFDTYHASAGQQARIANDLVQQLHAQGAPKQFNHALELGCGTGHLTQRLHDRFGFGSTTLNDLSPEAHSTAQAVNAAFLCGDATAIDWPERPDLIASASMIQWLPDPVAFLCKAATALAPGGWLAVSGFGPKQYHELVHVGSTAKAPGLCRSQDLAAAVQDDLQVLSCGDTQQVLQFATPRKVLEHLRRTGVNGRAQNVWTKTRLAQFTKDYIRHFGDENGVPLTYHPIWIIARKRS